MGRSYDITWFRATLWATAAASVACSDPSGLLTCADTAAIPLDGGSCVVFADDVSRDQRAAVEAVVDEAVAIVRVRIPVDGVVIRVITDAAGAIPEIGIGGRAVAGREVRISLDPGFGTLSMSIAEDLFPMLAHELHHIARQRTVGYGSTLLAAMVSEGLADHFSMEIAGGDPPPWATALTEDELDTWIAVARAEWLESGYDHDAWFFGTAPPIPRWAGYAIGFAITGAYLDANPDTDAASLYDERATSFQPAAPL